MSDLLNIGSSGLRAYRAALNATGENVANAETPGYARRSVRLEQARSSGGADVLYREAILFNGVSVAGVQRAWDSFRASEARYAASAAGRTEVREQWLAAAEGALNDGPGSVGVALTNFYAAATGLAPTPNDALGRSAMLMALQDAAGAFRRTGETLGRVADAIADAAGIEVQGVNNALKALDGINGTIRAAPATGSARASLEDERDRLIDYIAARLDVSVSIGGDGTTDLRLGSSATTPLLTGPGPGYITMIQAADGRLSLQLSINGTSAPLPVSDGRLAGLLEVASSTADKRAALDALASDFVGSLNAWSAAGEDANGNPGADLLEAPAGAASVRLLVSDPDLIAAATPSGTANGNLLALEALRASSGIEARWGALVSGNAQALASAKSEAAAASRWRDDSYASLDEVTGVDLDREAAEMLRYQQAYNGAARIIQVARETLNEIFALF